MSVLHPPLQGHAQLISPTETPPGRTDVAVARGFVVRSSSTPSSRAPPVGRFRDLHTNIARLLSHERHLSGRRRLCRGHFANVDSNFETNVAPLIERSVAPLSPLHADRRHAMRPSTARDLTVPLLPSLQVSRNRVWGGCASRLGELQDSTRTTASMGALWLLDAWCSRMPKELQPPGILRRPAARQFGIKEKQRLDQ